ncbi:MAG TPA: molecular chaperone TorD family protein [Streptosporangiaceae bacterium]|nr:molecular chaperone TorD family protein [Streptosporangiaceae bacterium]
MTQRWELLRALGAVADSPAAARAVAGPLGLDAVSDAEHTEAFVLNCPPYAAVYLGPDGALGGEGADRAAGFWRALGLTPPAEPDHLTALLALYAHLGEAAADTGRPATARALTQARLSLFREHLWPWLPAYLDAVADLGLPVLAGWAGLARRAVSAEFAEQPAWPTLPLALRTALAPPACAAGAEAGAGLDLRGLVDLLTTPVRSGIILTRRRLAAGAGEAGLGHRVGERRYALRAMLGQDPQAALTWAAAEAARWQDRHARRAAGDEVAAWWAGRAARTVDLLRQPREPR